MPEVNKHDLYPVLTFKNKQAFGKWLKKNHSIEDGVWVRIAKAKSGIASVTHAEALDEALCYGWIDGMRRSHDDIYFDQKFTPRRANSIWSEINKKKVDALIKSGEMQPAGLEAIEAAKKNGRWDNAYGSSRSITVPPDLMKALNKNVKAKKFFGKLSAQNRFAILFRIGQVKKEETRKKKIEQFVAMLEKHETIYPQS